MPNAKTGMRKVIIIYKYSYRFSVFLSDLFYLLLYFYVFILNLACILAFDLFHFFIFLIQLYFSSMLPSITNKKSFQIFLASLSLRRSLFLFLILYSPFPILNLREHIGFHRNLWMVADQMRKTWRLQLRFIS